MVNGCFGSFEYKYLHQAKKKFIGLVHTLATLDSSVESNASRLEMYANSYGFVQLVSSRPVFRLYTRIKKVTNQYVIFKPIFDALSKKLIFTYGNFTAERNRQRLSRLIPKLIEYIKSDKFVV